MPADFLLLDAAIQEATANATEIEGSADSVVSILGSVGAQIEAALKADNTIDQTNTDRAITNVRAVITRNQASAKKIADAIAANNQPPQPPTP